MFGAPSGLPFTAAYTRFIVGQALRFRRHEGCFLDQDALPLVSLAGSAPFEDEGGQGGMFACATGQRGIPRGQEYQVVEVGAGKAQRTPFPGKGDPRTLSQIFPALVAGGFPC